MSRKDFHSKSLEYTSALDSLNGLKDQIQSMQFEKQKLDETIELNLSTERKKT